VTEVPRLDIAGSLVLASGIVLALYGSTEGPLLGWTSAGSWPFWASGGFLLALYGIWALRRPHPAVNLALLKNGQAALGLGISNIASVVLFAILVLIPVFSETVLGASTFVTGLTLLPQGVITGVGILVGNWMYGMTNVRSVTLTGFAVLTATTFMLLFVELGTPLWAIAAILSSRGLALGLTIQPLLLATIGELAGADVPDGNTLFNVMERVFSSVGISLLSTYFQVSEQNYAVLLPRVTDAATSAFHDTILILTVVSLVGFGLGFLLKPRSPTTTMFSGRRAEHDDGKVLGQQT
jgi:predicted MFS family arabinose efflux permease